MNDSEEILKLRNARVENLKKSPYWDLLEQDSKLYLNGVITEDSFQKCIVDASRIWKERKSKVDVLKQVQSPRSY